MIQAECGVCRVWAIPDKETNWLVWNDIIAFINCFRSHLLYSLSFNVGYRVAVKLKTNSGERLRWEIESWFDADVALSLPFHAWGRKPVPTATVGTKTGATMHRKNLNHWDFKPLHLEIPCFYLFIYLLFHSDFPPCFPTFVVFWFGPTDRKVQCVNHSAPLPHWDVCVCVCVCVRVCVGARALVHHSSRGGYGPSSNQILLPPRYKGAPGGWEQERERKKGWGRERWHCVCVSVCVCVCVCVWAGGGARGP